MTALITVSDTRTFSLTNAYFSYVFRVTPEGILEHVYYGRSLSHPLEITSPHIRTERGTASEYQGVKHFNLSDTPQEYPSADTTDFRFPAFHARKEDGHNCGALKYKSHRITSEKPALSGLPSARGGDSETLIVTLEDPLSSLEVGLYYTIYATQSVIVRSCQFFNKSASPINLQHAFSSAIDMPSGQYEILHMHGTWAREFNTERINVPKGRFVIDSARGTSSAAHNPFLAVMEKGAREDHGRVYASTLIYSGNFAMSVETGEFDDVRVLSGINPFNFKWCLEPGESFATPEALHLFTDQGLRAMSHGWHKFIRDKVLPERFKNVARPTYLNTWEAAYFDVTEDKVLTLADKAKEIGVDMLVLDDGWFKGRQDDTTSLGDWVADGARFPSGIPTLAKKVKAKGLKFGIWFEPEMVSPKSALYDIHSDWVLHVPGRTPSLGRNQLTLDLSRPEVCDYVFDCIDKILSCGDIDYVKWDMNRNMSDVGSKAHPAHRQAEIPHRYMLGLYGVLQRLTDKYPDVLFENCASGGNRFDLGMLRFMPQGWISDMCDPIGRLEIINGASLVYPLDAMAAYIGPSPNHQNDRVSSLETRFMAGIFCAAKGVSLNEADIDADLGALQNLMAQAKAMAPSMLGGRFDRLIKTDSETCWQYTTADGATVYVAYYHTLAAPNLPFRRAHLVGLCPEALYIAKDTQKGHRGDALMHAGLPLPYVSTQHSNPTARYMPKGDFSAYLFEFTKTT